MSEAIWSVLLVSISVTGLWLAPRHWWGWCFNAVGELLWVTYAATIGSVALAIMSGIFFCVYTRNAYITLRMKRNGNN